GVFTAGDDSLPAFAAAVPELAPAFPPFEAEFVPEPFPCPAAGAKALSPPGPAPARPLPFPPAREFPWPSRDGAGPTTPEPPFENGSPRLLPNPVPPLPVPPAPSTEGGGGTA